MRRFMLIVAVLMIAATNAQAQKLGDYRARLSLAANGSGMWFSRAGNVNNWNGIDVGGAATYNLHELFSVYGAYDHGFSTNNAGQMNFARIIGNLKVYPGPTVRNTKNAIFIGAGKGWFGKHTVKDWNSYEAQVVVAHKIQPRAAVFGLYSHSFLTQGGPDFDFLKLGLNLKLWP